MAAGAVPLRLVLDTNVWLDWLVFDDAVIAPLKRAHAEGAIEICINEPCEREFAEVLAYDLGKHTIDVGTQAACFAECRRIARPHPDLRPHCGGRDKIMGATGKHLPQCRDPDDQKFLELARDYCADYLVTKDRALLVLARRKTRPPPCRIVTPREFCAILGG